MKNTNQIRVTLKALDRFSAALREFGQAGSAAAYGLAILARQAGKSNLVFALADYATRHYSQAGPWAEMLGRNKINWI